MRTAKWLLYIPAYGGILFIFLLMLNVSMNKSSHISNKKVYKVFLIFAGVFILSFVFSLLAIVGTLSLITDTLDEKNFMIIQMVSFFIAGVPTNIYLYKTNEILIEIESGNNVPIYDNTSFQKKITGIGMSVVPLMYMLLSLLLVFSSVDFMINKYLLSLIILFITCTISTITTLYYIKRRKTRDINFIKYIITLFLLDLPAMSGLVLLLIHLGATN